MWAVLLAVVVAVGFGLYRAATDGRFRGTHHVRGAELPPEEAGVGADVAGAPWADQLGERATLLQFSSAFCAPCRATRRVLADVASSTPGIAHIDVDAEHHLDVVRRLGVMRTPTTLILDAQGREIGRARGVPTKDLVVRALPSP